MNKAKIALQFVLYTLICIVVVGAAYAMGYAMRSAHAPATGDVAEFGVFWEAWRLVDDHFYGDTTDTTQRTYGAVRGSMQALDDPYTLFVEPQQRDREQEELQGSFGGIGAWVERAPDGRILLTPMDDRPAQKAGVRSGDELLAVDGTPVTPEMPFDDVLALVRGEAGAIVVLTVRREGVEEPIDIEVERAEIVTPSVTYELKEEDVGYIRISIFGERTADELEDAARDLADQGATSYIIDLRDNGGGLLPAAVDVASQFLREGVVLYERKSDGTEKAFDVHGRGVLRDDPVVFLVNNATASASEIVAGAIQDYERGVLIGTETFGKASVQFIFDLSDGSSVHITNAKWLTPNRQEIDGVGLTPDIVVPITEEDYQAGRDPQVEQAIAYLKDNS